MKLDKETKDEVEKVVHSVHDTEMRKTRVMQCSMGNHVWRKLNDTEIACNICPTILIVGNADDFMNN